VNLSLTMFKSVHDIMSLLVIKQFVWVYKQNMETTSIPRIQKISFAQFCQANVGKSCHPCFLLVIIIVIITIIINDNVYGAFLMTTVTARVQPVHLMNADWAPGGRQPSDPAGNILPTPRKRHTEFRGTNSALTGLLCLCHGKNT